MIRKEKDARSSAEEQLCGLPWVHNSPRFGDDIGDVLPGFSSLNSMCSTIGWTQDASTRRRLPPRHQAFEAAAHVAVRPLPCLQTASLVHGDREKLLPSEGSWSVQPAECPELMESQQSWSSKSCRSRDANAEKQNGDSVEFAERKPPCVTFSSSCTSALRPRRCSSLPQLARPSGAHFQ